MDVIGVFVARYVKEYDFYDQAARLVKERLETSLRASGVRCMVTSRAKDVPRLEEKCRQRDRSRHYASADQIFDDIADLAGVRVALYFPAERHQVDTAINNLFRLLEPRRVFPTSEIRATGKRFAGYSAVHYRVQLKEDELSGTDRRYALAKVEIQVASVLMHAWSEVEHDLVYKPLEGDLSDDENAMLDQLNGMVIAGEIVLETLQRAGERRISQGGRTFVSHYELAAYLLSRVGPKLDEPLAEAGLGRVDLLLALLHRLGIDTPGQLNPYLEALHGNLEERPLAEQVVDALVREDESRYDVYLALQEEAARRSAERELGDHDVYQKVGHFVARWADLERLLWRLASTQDPPPRKAEPVSRLLGRLDFLDQDMRQEIDRLRTMRNYVMHGNGMSTAPYLAEATKRVESIIEEILRRTEQEEP